MKAEIDAMAVQIKQLQDRDAERQTTFERYQEQINRQLAEEESRRQDDEEAIQALLA